MSNDEAKIKQIKNDLSEFDLRSLNLANFTPKEEVHFHQYIKGICQRLLGNTLDLDEQNIIFALSDKDETNAACVSKGNVNVVYITEKLLDLCKNEDQLAFILGHELGHFEERLRQNAHQNSKAEETACDLRAIQKMAHGGYNLEEACNIAVELFDKHSISIDDLKDPHTNDGSRVNLINAMKKREKDRIIEEQNVEITKSTPLPEDIINLVHNRVKHPPFTESLFSQMQLASDADNSDNDETRIAVWLKAFHEHIVSDGRSYAMTKDDVKSLASCLDRCFYDSDKFADKFLAAVFADMESLRNDSNFQVYTEIMHNVLDEIWSSDAEYCHAKVDADEKDSKTAAWLRRYLHGFREANNEQYDNIINNLEYVKLFVAHHNFNNYRGIYVKNFNLLELDFNENDVGKKLSPQILKYIRQHINAKDKFVTFSGLTAHKMGNALVLTHEKNNWSVFVDASGEIAYSFPAKELVNMQTLLIKKIVENTQNNLKKVANGAITDISSRLEILREAYDIVSPVSYKNDLKSILEIRNKDEDTKDVLYNDVIAVISPETRQFFDERIAENSDNLPYTEMITDLYADAVRTAPKEKFNEILDAIVTHRVRYRLSGEDKLLRAFFDNPAFNKELSDIVKSYEPFPEKSQGWDWDGMFEKPDSDIRCRLSNLVSTIKEITDCRLKEHLENGGNFDNFEQPFKKDLAKLFGFAPEGEIDEAKALENLKQTRNHDNACIPLYEQAYIAYSSYDTLKSDDNTNIEFLLGFNVAGVDMKSQYYRNDYFLKSAEKYHIDIKEQEQIKERQKKLLTAADKVHDKLLERINSETNKGNISADDIFYMTLYNDYHTTGIHGQNGFDTVISNFDFEKRILYNLENGSNSDIHSSILSLSHLVKAFDNTKEGDAYKEKIWPSIAKIFEREDIQVTEKTDNLIPEARANRRIGKILFDAVFQNMSEGKSFDISSDAARKLISRLANSDADLQIVKGVVRGAYAKLNPSNYTKKDKEELGMFLYQVCQTDIKNQKLQKGEAIENIISEVTANSPQMGSYTQNVMKLVSVMAKIPTLSDNKLKKAAAFVAFADNDVARGFKKALNEDKSVGFVKRMMLKLAPMDFIPHNAKKMLIKAVSKRFVANYVSKQLFNTSKSLDGSSNSTHR